jgi:hypothetical protein
MSVTRKERPHVAEICRQLSQLFKWNPNRLHSPGPFRVPWYGVGSLVVQFHRDMVSSHRKNNSNQVWVPIVRFTENFTALFNHFTTTFVRIPGFHSLIIKNHMSCDQCKHRRLSSGYIFIVTSVLLAHVFEVILCSSGKKLMEQLVFLGGNICLSVCFIPKIIPLKGFPCNFLWVIK